MIIKNKLPWQAKLLSKLIFSRIPIKYSLWKWLDLFKHGEMEKPSYAYDVFKKHFDRVVFSRKSGNFVALELGPGDSLFSAMIAYAFGASSVYLVDVGNFISDDIKPYFSMANYLKEKSSTTPNMDDITSLERLLELCNAKYMTSGILSLRTIPDQSVDLIWSQAVLEHVRRSDFISMMRELRRVIRPDGICSHCIDLRDHLGGALNNLRFSERFWESDFIAKSGFYTNRIRYSEMLELFNQAGFNVEKINVEFYDRLPTPRNKLSSEFKHLTDKELSVSVFDVILKPM